MNTIISIQDLPLHLQPIFKAEENKAGIYVVASRTLKKGYIGQSKNIMVRWCGHYTAMANGNHWASEVQQAVAHYGSDDFVFAVLEYVEPDTASLNVAERLWKKRSQKFLLNNQSLGARQE